MSDPILLISEARGEFLIVEGIRAELAERGRATVHVTSTKDDLSPEEAGRSGVFMLDAEPAFVAGAAMPVLELGAAIEREQAALDVNLRRVWKADLRSWRQGVDDDEMARLALGYLGAWRRIFDSVGPIAGIWAEDGGHLAKRTAFLLAEPLGIPMWFLYQSPLPGRLLALEDPLNRFSREDFEAVAPAAEERAYAHSLLDDVRASRVQFATPRDLTFRPARLVRFARLLAQTYVGRAPGSQAHAPFYFGRAYVRQRATAAALRSVYGPLGDRPFVFYPVHAGFDAQISIRAPQWENQLALIEHLASSLPYGYELAVKEHPFEVGALPLGPLRRLLSHHREIRLLDPTIHAHAILRRASAVATVNSTTGFEALFYGVPVVTFGHGPYRGLGLTRDVESPFDTPRLLLEAVSDPPTEEDAVRLIAFLFRNSFPGTSVSYDAGVENLARHADAFEALAARRDA